MRVSQREAELRELVITGLSHLVIANTESGFKQCLPLAYDQDSRKRAIFANVFARVLGQGAKFDPEDRSVTLARQARLREVSESFCASYLMIEVLPHQLVKGSDASFCSAIFRKFPTYNNLDGARHCNVRGLPPFRS
jgi:hypothetical protein